MEEITIRQAPNIIDNLIEQFGVDIVLGMLAGSVYKLGTKLNEKIPGKGSTNLRICGKIGGIREKIRAKTI